MRLISIIKSDSGSKNSSGRYVFYKLRNNIFFTKEDRLLRISLVFLFQMLFKIVHSIVLLCYLNILVYQPESGYAMRYDDSLLNGESLLEIVLDDVLALPIDKDTADVEILYDEYRSHEYKAFSLSLFVLLLTVLFSFEQLATYVKHPVYDGKKRRIIPNYYTHLHRLQPF